MNVSGPYSPLAADHPAVRDALLCPCCEQPFAAGAVTCLCPVGEPDEHNVCEARLLHHGCAEQLSADARVRQGFVAQLRQQAQAAVLNLADVLIADRERLRSATARDPGTRFFDSEEEDTPEHELAQLREALGVCLFEGRRWRHYALDLERMQPDDSRRLAWLEQRLREHGPDLGYLLGLPQGWTNLRAAVDQAQAAPQL